MIHNSIWNSYHIKLIFRITIWSSTLEFENLGKYSLVLITYFKNLEVWIKISLIFTSWSYFAVFYPSYQTLFTAQKIQSRDQSWCAQ